MKPLIISSIMWIIVGLLLTGCERFLEAKPINTIAQPSSLKDLRAMLDDETYLNDIYPWKMGSTVDELEINYSGLASLPQMFQDVYLWEDKDDNDTGNWSRSYRAVSIANVVLEALERIKGGSPVLRKQLEGEALFIRGWVFFNLAQVYCKPYNKEYNKNNLGLVLRLDADSEVKIVRSTLKETYDRIFQDLDNSLQLLPDQSEYITRPSKLVVKAAMARMYLAIEDYEKAEVLVDEVLKVKKDLLDFNKLNQNVQYPVALQENNEIFYYATGYSSGYFIANVNTYVNPELIGLYDNKDLRLKVYYESGLAGMKYRGFYHGKMSDYFAGFATDEMYLIKAECAARRKDILTGGEFLNELRRFRFKSEDFQPITFSDHDILLSTVLEERRRQLIGRGTRWLDLRRLNQDPKFAKVLTRKLDNNGTVLNYELKPNDPRYVSLIPLSAIEVGGYEQNSR